MLPQLNKICFLISGLLELWSRATCWKGTNDVGCSNYHSHINGYITTACQCHFAASTHISPDTGATVGLQWTSGSDGENRLNVLRRFDHTHSLSRGCRPDCMKHGIKNMILKVERQLQSRSSKFKRKQKAKTQTGLKTQKMCKYIPSAGLICLFNIQTEINFILCFEFELLVGAAILVRSLQLKCRKAFAWYFCHMFRPCS